MTPAEFHQAHGPAWAQIVRTPAFAAALMVCGSERLKEIEQLGNAQIEANGRVHLANFQGHLQTEAILMSLAIESEEPFDFASESTYEDPDASRQPTPPQPEPTKRTRKRT